MISFDLTGKVAVVTGASSGLGEQFAKALSEQWCDVAVLARRVERLEELSKKPSLSGFKFFSEEEDKDAAKGKVQIMTLHKSKGDEFEYVFLPEMAEKNLSIDVNQAKLKAYFIYGRS